MDEITKNITVILTAIIGVALLTVIVSKKNNTGSVVSSAAKGFSSILSVAMGGANSPTSQG